MSYRARHDPAAFLGAAGPVVRVAVERTEGSAPRAAGTWMLVSAAGTFGTIGGGSLEYMALDRARAMLAAGTAAETMAVPLGPGIGQCCGGRVSLSLWRLDTGARAALAAEAAAALGALPEVWLFGAGHVGRALARAFAQLPVRVTLADTRAAELAAVPEGVTARLVAVPEALVRAAAPGGAYLIATHDHALDFLIAEAALARGDAAYVGMIGSRTKRAAFTKWLSRQGGGAGRLVCPIAAETRDKRPEVIAAFAAAEVMACLARHREEMEATP